MDFVLEILKFTLPAVIVLIAAYLMISSMLDNALKQKQLELNMKQAEANKNTKSEMLPLRLQAYERLALYLERINPQGLVNRLRQEDMTAPEFHYALISSIRLEYEHNLTQQLYISSEAWMLIQGVTEETISIINQIASSLPTDASGTDLGMRIIQHFLGNDLPIPSYKALEQLKDEIRMMF